MGLRRAVGALPVLLLILLNGCDMNQPASPAFAVLNAPTSLSANPSSATLIAVIWQDNAKNEDGFELHRSTTGPGGTFGWLASTQSGFTSYSDAGLTPSTQYCYKVRAFRTTGNKTSYSEFSATACATTPAPPPGAIRVATVTTGADLDPDGYKVQVDAGALQAIAINGAVIMPDLSPGTHSVTLSDVAANCSLSGVNPRSVDVLSGQTIDVPLAVSCRSTTPLQLRGDIAFSSNRDGDFAIYIMRADGSEITRLTDASIRIAAPDWSRDGTKLVFTGDEFCFRDIYVVTNGEVPVRLTSCEGTDRDPAWSPDGQKIAFNSDIETRETSCCYDDIYVMNADGSGVTRLTDNPGEDWLPSWSPDGTKIAFSSDRAGEYPALDIYVMNADGSGVVRLTQDNAFNITPAWSPDGNKIAFSSNREGYNEIYVMNADGSDVVRLTYDNAYNLHPTWSPDGSMIAFMRSIIGCDDWGGCYITSAAIAVMRADGSGLVNITDGSAEDGEPSWRETPAGGSSVASIAAALRIATQGQATRSGLVVSNPRVSTTAPIDRPHGMRERIHVLKRP